MEIIKWHLISLSWLWRAAVLVPKVVKLCSTSPLMSVINTTLSLSRLLATLTFLSRVSYRDIFSAKVLLCCHVPGCHEGALLDTVSRSRCEPHASNPKLRFAYYTQNHRTPDNWNQVSHSSQWCFISGRVSPFTTRETCRKHIVFVLLYSWVLLWKKKHVMWNHFAMDVATEQENWKRREQKQYVLQYGNGRQLYWCRRTTKLSRRNSLNAQTP